MTFAAQGIVASLPHFSPGLTRQHRGLIAAVVGNHQDLVAVPWVVKAVQTADGGGDQLGLVVGRDQQHEAWRCLAWRCRQNFALGAPSGKGRHRQQHEERQQGQSHAD